MNASNRREIPDLQTWPQGLCLKCAEKFRKACCVNTFGQIRKDFLEYRMAVREDNTIEARCPPDKQSTEDKKRILAEKKMERQRPKAGILPMFFSAIFLS
jgi:hypothetical protein